MTRGDRVNRQGFEALAEMLIKNEMSDVRQSQEKHNYPTLDWYEKQMKSTIGLSFY